MPYVSKFANSKLAFRAIQLKDTKMLKRLLKDPDRIHCVCLVLCDIYLALSFHGVRYKTVQYESMNTGYMLYAAVLNNMIQGARIARW